MITKRFSIIALLSVVLYTVLYFFLKDTFLYIIGGALGSFIKLFSQQVNILLLSIMWLGLLLTFIFFYYKTSSKSLRYLFLLLIAILLYLVDFILYRVLNYDTTNVEIRYLNDSILILLKSLFLSFVIYFDKKISKKATQ